MELNFEIRRAEGRHDQDVWGDCEDSKLHDLLLTAGQGFVAASFMLDAEYGNPASFALYTKLGFIPHTINTQRRRA